MKHPLAALLFASCAFASGITEAAGSAPSGDPARYNVVWNSPSKNSLGSMPIGNGDIGANVWVEPSGDLVQLLSKSDAWDENMRLVKLGRVRIHLDSANGAQPDTKAGTQQEFHQELFLRDGAIEVRMPQASLRVWIDAQHPVVQVDGQSESGKVVGLVVTPDSRRKDVVIVVRSNPTSNEGCLVSP